MWLLQPMPTVLIIISFEFLDSLDKNYAALFFLTPASEKEIYIR